MRIVTILSAGSLLALGCSSFTSPPEAEIEPKPASQATAPALVRPAASVVQAPRPPPPKEPEIRASHLLVAYKEARSASPKIVRSKEQARKRAEELMKKAQAGADFADLAKQSSDDVGSGAHGGDLGLFTRAQMVKPFADAAFALRPGEVSAVVESEFGFHVIKRAP